MYPNWRDDYGFPISFNYHRGRSHKSRELVEWPNYTLYTAHSTLHTANFTLHTSHCTQHTTHCKLHTAQFKMKTAYCTLHTSHCTLHTENSSMYCVLKFEHCLGPRPSIKSRALFWASIRSIFYKLRST